MNDIFDILSYVTLSLLALTAPLAIPGVLRLPVYARLFLMLPSLLLAWAPIAYNRPVLFYARGVLGDLSVTTLVIVMLAAARGLGWNSDYTKSMPRDTGLLLACIFCVLYACSLGYIPFDLYAWGYQPRWLIGVAGGLLAYAWWRHPGLACAWLVALGLFALNVLPSVNMWDALGDPLLCLGGAWRFLFRGPTLAVAPSISSNSEAELAQRVAA